MLKERFLLEEARKLPDSFGPETLVEEKTTLENETLKPTVLLIAKKNLQKFLADVGKALFDPVSEFKTVETGKIGQIIGMPVYTDAYEKEPFLDNNYVALEK